MLKINKKQLPVAFEKFVNDVCNACAGSNYKNTFRLAPCLIPLDSGNGRTRATRLIAEKFLEKKVCKFSSRDIFLEFNLKNGNVSDVNIIDAEVQTFSEYDNDYAGIVSLCVNNDFLSHLNDAAGVKFFELIAKIRKNAVVLIFVPADCNQKQLDIISEKIGAAGIKVFSPIAYNDTDYARFFYDFISQSIKPSNSSFEKHKEYISVYIQNIPNKSIKKIKESAEALVFNREAREKLFGSKKQAIIKESEVIKL
jgi:hypothetical protein